MSKRIELHPSSLLSGGVMALVLFLALGMTSDSSSGVDAAISPDRIVNIAGQRFNNNPVGTIYTVPQDKILVIRGVFVTGFDDTGLETHIGLNLKCGTDMMIPRQVMTHLGEFEPFFMDDLGWTCGPGSAVRLVGGQPLPGIQSIGWSLVGELVDASPPS